MRLNVLVLVAGIVTASLPAATLSAQQVGIAPGSRVRVSTPSLVAPLIANFLEQRGDTLVFIEDGSGRGVWPIPLSQIQRLETTGGESARSSTAVMRGAAIGGLSGFVAGALFAASVKPSDSGKTYDRLLTGAVGAAVGIGIGAFIGSRVKSERWVNVALPGRLTFAPDLKGGFRIGISIH